MHIAVTRNKISCGREKIQISLYQMGGIHEEAKAPIDSIGIAMFDSNISICLL